MVNVEARPKSSPSPLLVNSNTFNMCDMKGFTVVLCLNYMYMH
ncbi:unnamed protein product [Chironomus riparius]|uniref:Uncharacterized protein n=1 Tax=Chironomus riparius TaxID=315576 RepID=A0A9N9RN54_9DIPT|nr:unnamed protein product [Chironomus riparius]